MIVGLTASAIAFVVFAYADSLWLLFLSRIVQGAGDSAATLPLPFEGDRMLAVILSKAFLLAADKKIKDETIRRQLAL